MASPLTKKVAIPVIGVTVCLIIFFGTMYIASRNSEEVSADTLVSDLRYGSDEAAEEAGRRLLNAAGAVEKLVNAYDIGANARDKRTVQVLRKFGQNAIDFLQERLDHPTKYGTTQLEEARELLTQLREPILNPPAVAAKEEKTDSPETESKGVTLPVKAEKDPCEEKPSKQEPTIAPPLVKPEPKEEQMTNCGPQCPQQIIVYVQAPPAQAPVIMTPPVPATPPAPPPVDLVPVEHRITKLEESNKGRDEKLADHGTRITAVEAGLVTVKAEVKSVSDAFTAEKRDFRGQLASLSGDVSALKERPYSYFDKRTCRWVTVAPQ